MLTFLCLTQGPKCYGKSADQIEGPKIHPLIVQDIEVPETLLKKRKQNEKAREDRLAAITAARKVRYTSACAPMMHIFL